jgi:hypothetical protein
MIAVQSYLYDNIVQVQILDTAIFKTRNRTVYNRPIKIYQGIDNPILVHVKNQDQKSVNIDSKSILVEIQDPINELLIVSYPLVWEDSSKGIGFFTITKADIDVLVQRYYKLALKLVDDVSGVERPLYSNDNYGVSLDIEVLPGYYQNQNPNTVLYNGGNAGNMHTIAPNLNGGTA